MIIQLSKVKTTLIDLVLCQIILFWSFAVVSRGLKRIEMGEKIVLVLLGVTALASGIFVAKGNSLIIVK